MTSWLVLFSCTPLLLGQTAKNAEAGVQSVILRGIVDYRDGMRSADEKKRQQTFDRFMPDMKVAWKLFGEDSKLLEPSFEVMAKRRGNTLAVKEDLDKQGGVKKVELIDIRSENNESYKKLFAKIPKNIPVYRAVVTSDKEIITNSSAYLVIDGQMVFFRGIDGIPNLLEDLQKKKKAPK